jgi:hypothetical protein
MRLSARDFERAIFCLGEYQSTHSGLNPWVIGSWQENAIHGYEHYPPSEFLVRLGQMVYGAASYERWLSVGRHMIQIMSVFRLEGD